MPILPNSRASTGWRRGYLTNNFIKEIFDVGVLNSGIPELQRYNYDDNTSELNSSGHFHKTPDRRHQDNDLIIKPSEWFQDTRVILKFF